MKQVGRKKLGKKRAHRKSMMQNQLRSLFERGYLQTTTAKAKTLKANSESLLNRVGGAKDNLVLTRYLKTLFGKDELVSKVKEYVDGKDAKVRVVKIGFRDGDNAELSRVSLVDYLEGEPKTKAAEKKSKKKEGSKDDKDGGDGQEVTHTEVDKGDSQKLKTKVTKQRRTRARSGL